MITKQKLLDKIEQANSNDEYLRIVRKYIIHGIPYVLRITQTAIMIFVSRLQTIGMLDFRKS